MLRPLSNQKKYEAFYSGDPAVIQLPEGLKDKARIKAQKERAKKIERARETGDWSEVLVNGETPTRFSMRPIPTAHYGELALRLESARTVEDLYPIYLLAFCIALVDVYPLPEDVSVARIKHPKYGDIATTDFLDEAQCGGELGAAIIFELGHLAVERAREVSPKS